MDREVVTASVRHCLRHVMPVMDATEMSNQAFPQHTRHVSLRAPMEQPAIPEQHISAFGQVSDRGNPAAFDFGFE